LLLVIAAACVIILRKSFVFIDTAPFMNPDDSIPNVAVSLAEHGRYGFLSSPTQGLHDVDRTHAFFNYGPLCIPQDWCSSCWLQYGYSGGLRWWEPRF
jgi:hypothetical protein